MRLVTDTIEFAHQRVPQLEHDQRSAATTSARRARRRCRSWPSRWPTASTTSSGRWRAAWTSTTSRRGSRFFFNAHNDFFEEIAKYRAARRIWARDDARALRRARTRARWWLRFHTQTAGVSAARRSSRSQHGPRRRSRRWRRCWAARSRCTPTAWTRRWPCRREKAVRLALRTQQVLAHESGVTNTVDPLGGSYFVETLTNEMERQAFDYFDRIEALGGVLPAIERASSRTRSPRASYEYQRRSTTHAQDDGRRERVRAGRAARDPDPGDGPAGRGAPAASAWPVSRRERDPRPPRRRPGARAPQPPRPQREHHARADRGRPTPMPRWARSPTCCAACFGVQAFSTVV